MPQREVVWAIAAVAARSVAAISKVILLIVMLSFFSFFLLHGAVTGVTAQVDRGVLEEPGGADGPVAVLAVHLVARVLAVDVLEGAGDAQTVSSGESQVPEQVGTEADVP